MHFSVAIGIVVTFMALLELWLVHDSYSTDHTSITPPRQS
jgi:hypothetical protein